MAVAEAAAVFRRYRSPGTVVGRFVFRRHLKSFLFGGVLFAGYIISKASSYVSLYPTPLSRERIAATLGSNVGIEALVGRAANLTTVGGYMVWNFLCLLAAVGAVWSFITAVRSLRGEEDMGRWEMMLLGQTTPRKATVNVLASLYGGLAIIYVFLLLGIGSVARLHGANLTVSGSLFFVLALLCGAIEFLAVGALMSQLIPSRGRAVGFSAIIFGVFYVVRVVADTTSAHWLLDLSPLGWIEKLQPMYASRPIWLLPIFVFALILSCLAVWLAGRRDMYDAIFPDKGTAKAHTRLLRTPFGLAVRLSRPATIGWVLAVGLLSLLYALVTKAAGQAFSESTTIGHALAKFTENVQHTATLTFVGIIFFFAMILVMVYAATAVSKVRNDEAEGYLDNLLVRPVSRMRWYWGRAVLILGVIIVACLVSAVVTWLGMLNQHVGVSFHSLLLAGLNIIAPAVLVSGIGLSTFGIVPRLTNFLAYGAVGWSFLIMTLGEGLKFNHWLVDTSIISHVPLAPVVNPDWGTSAIMIAIGLLLCLIGDIAFTERDLQPE